MKETIEKTCICGIRISFDQKILSQYKNFDGGKINLKPIEIQSKLPHDCSLRGWSIDLVCNKCGGGPIKFHNNVVGPKGNKIPHDGRDLKPHKCSQLVVAK